MKDVKKQEVLLKIILIFVLIQPILDILSRLAILNIIPNISLYIKPLFVFGVGAYLLFYSPIKKRWLVYISIFILFTLTHLYILYLLLVDTSVILHEFRYIVNIAYMIALGISLYTLCYYAKDKEAMYKKIKKVLFYTFAIYFLFYFLAVITNTSGMTYEYADKNKLGFKGWYESGQILGHAFSITFPILLYGILKVNKNKIVKTLFLLFTLIFVSLLGTKVPYIITIVVLVLYLIIVFAIKIFNHDFRKSWFNVILVSIAVIGMVLTYKYTPVAYNTNLNRMSANTSLDDYDVNTMSGKQDDLESILKKHPGRDARYLRKYYGWGEEASSYLKGLFKKGIVHPSNTRSLQFFYSYKKFMVADPPYKIFGIGYLNQDGLLTIECDFFMALFNFGLLGFVLFLLLPIKEFVTSGIFILKNLKKIDLETYMLFMGLGIFFCISIYAGYTYIYTNFSIYLILLMTLLKLNRDIIRQKNLKPVKTISFLSLHLGYGGIESATINSANTLSDDYDVEIISLYNLKRNQEFNLNKKIKVTYLTNLEPNKEKFLEYKNNHEYFYMLLEGFKSIKILLLKMILVRYAILRCKSDAIVSTRVEFNLLLNKYGSKDTLKIAQEHCYHNNDKKYINKIKNGYYNIDYLCALTKTLKNDYEEFLVNNSYTKVVLLPNMLTYYPNKKSDLKSDNAITISRLAPLKRNDEIIKIFSQVQNKKSKLFIIGDGEEYQNLEKLIKELKLEDKVYLVGYKTHEEIQDYLLDSSVFLMASETEGLPMVLLEAMSYGVPCLAYDIPSGVNDIIEDSVNGYIIKNRDKKLYLEKLDKLLDDDNLRKKMGKKALEKSLEFSNSNILKIWNKILKREM